MPITVISSTLLPAASYLLTDLDTVKDELEIDDSDTSRDVFLTRILSSTSSAIAAWCNRVFPQETALDAVYPERDAYPYQVPGGVAPLQLSRWPVAAGTATLATTEDNPAGATLTLPSVAGLAAGMPVSGGNVIVPSPTLTSITNAPVPSGTFIAAIAGNVVTLNQPTTGDVPAGATLWFGTAVSIIDPPGTLTTLVPGAGFLIDGGPGQLTRIGTYQLYPLPWMPVQTLVTYQGGFATIPDDLVDATLRLVTQRYQMRGRDPTIKSQDQPGLGSTSYWVGSIPGVRGAFPEEIADALSRYRVPVVCA
jgi:hypothetical protein